MNQLIEQNQSVSMDFAARAMTASAQNHGAAVEIAKAVREVEASLIVARAHRRDELAAYNSVIETCKRPSFAERAMYRYERAGQTVEGASIRLAEAMARAYGNLDFGIREIERSGNKSIVEAYCWDYQTNVKRRTVFEVLHIRDTKKGQKPLTSERDIYELIANYGARRMRQCILSLIPPDIIEAAILEVKTTMRGQIKSNKIDQSKKILAAFEAIGVTNDQLKKFLNVDAIQYATDTQLLELKQIYTSIRDGVASAEEFFKVDAPEFFKQQGIEDEIKQLKASILLSAKKMSQTADNAEYQMVVDLAAKADASTDIGELNRIYSVFTELEKGKK
jgi:hypothetical protein